MRASIDIAADLEAAYAARRKALTAQEYAMNTGQGNQSVRRVNLKDLNEMITQLEKELEEAQSNESGNTGLTHVSFTRNL